MAMDLAAGLVFWLERVYKRMVDDLLATPEAQRNISSGGVTRSPLFITAECAWINERIATRLAGNPVAVMTPEERIAFFEKFTDSDETLAYLKSGTDALIAAIRATDPDTWGEVIDLFPGRPQMSRFDGVMTAIAHTSYHDGQLNHVHMLCGDSAIHWK